MLLNLNKSKGKGQSAALNHDLKQVLKNGQIESSDGELL